MLAEETLDTGVWCLSPARLWSCTRRCCPSSLWRVSSTPTQPCHHPPPPHYHARPPPTPHTSCTGRPQWGQGRSHNILPWSKYWLMVIKLIQLHGEEPILLPLFPAARAWVWCAHRTRMRMLKLEHFLTWQFFSVILWSVYCFNPPTVYLVLSSHVRWL